MAFHGWFVFIIETIRKWVSRVTESQVKVIGDSLFTWPWWRNQMDTLSALLAICARNSPVTVEFSAQRPVTRSFDVLFDLRLNKRLSKPWWGWWFETPSGPLWCHCNDQKIVIHGRPYMILSLTRYLCVALTHHRRQLNCDVNIRQFSFHAPMGEN